MISIFGLNFGWTFLTARSRIDVNILSTYRMWRVRTEFKWLTVRCSGGCWQHDDKISCFLNVILFLTNSSNKSFSSKNTLHIVFMNDKAFNMFVNNHMLLTWHTYWKLFYFIVSFPGLIYFFLSRVFFFSRLPLYSALFLATTDWQTYDKLELMGSPVATVQARPGSRCSLFRQHFRHTGSSQYWFTRVQFAAAPTKTKIKINNYKKVLINNKADFRVFSYSPNCDSSSYRIINYAVSYLSPVFQKFWVR